jgi:DNA-binding MarR family transcriptional regulator
MPGTMSEGQHMSTRSDQLLDNGSGALHLTHPQYLTLLALDQPAPQTCIQVASTLRLTAGTMTPLLQRLDTLGLIRRDRNPNDDRQLELSLTAEGRKLLPALWHIGAQVQRTVRDDANDSELKGLLQHMVATGN